jgi:CheY-like chemotaxis protein
MKQMSEQVADQSDNTKISRLLAVDDDAASRKLICKTLLDLEMPVMNALAA